MQAIIRSLVLLLLFSLTLSAQSGTNKQAERLQREKNNLNRQTDPVGRTKTQIKIAEILLTLIGETVQSGDMELMQKRLAEYTAAIEDAHQTMMKTGRDAHRKPGGFKDLEIALRRHVRQLEDIGKGLSIDQREPVDKAKDNAADIRDELLKALFGEQNAPSRKS
jgi:type II secretory pathway pseudopilin PulG